MIDPEKKVPWTHEFSRSAIKYFLGIVFAVLFFVSLAKALDLITWPGLRSKNEAIEYHIGNDIQHSLVQEQESDNKGFDADNQQRRNTYAQEGVWRASSFMAWVAAIQAFLTLGTVGLVYLTYKSQRSQIIAANRSADAGYGMLRESRNQLKPYFKILSPPTIQPLCDGSMGTDVVVDIAIELENTGVTCANNVRFRIERADFVLYDAPKGNPVNFQFEIKHIEEELAPYRSGWLESGVLINPGGRFNFKNCVTFRFAETVLLANSDRNMVPSVTPALFHKLVSQEKVQFYFWLDFVFDDISTQSGITQRVCRVCVSRTYSTGRRADDVVRDLTGFGYRMISDEIENVEVRSEDSFF